MSQVLSVHYLGHVEESSNISKLVQKISPSSERPVGVAEMPFNLEASGSQVMMK